MTKRRTTLIAIVGGSGAGKSWLAERLCRALGEHACRLSLDDFYRDRSHLPPPRRAKLNYDTPTAIDWASARRVLHDCRAGEPTRIPCYDFATYCRSPECRSWLPRPIVFAEGLWWLRDPEIRGLFDLSIYLDAPGTLREDRRVARDTLERGYTEDVVRERLELVRPMHDRHVEPQRRWADLVLPQPFDAESTELLAERLWPHVSRDGVLPPWGQNTFRTELLSLIAEHEYCS